MIVVNVLSFVLNIVKLVRSTNEWTNKWIILFITSDLLRVEEDEEEKKSEFELPTIKLVNLGRSERVKLSFEC